MHYSVQIIPQSHGKYSLNMLKRLFLVSCLLFGAVTFLSAQSEKPHLPYAFGVYALFNENFHSTNFQKIPGYPNCCPHFESGSGAGFDVGVLGEYDLDTRWQLGLRLGYASLGGVISAREQDSLTTITTSNGTEQARIDHNITAHISNLHLEPMIIAQVTSRFSAFASLPICLSTKTQFDQIEQLAADQSGVFTTGLRTRNAFNSQEIPQAITLYAMASIGLRYDFPLNKNQSWLLAPEIRYTALLPRVSKSVEWRINSIQAGVSLRYHPIEPPLMRYDTIIHRDTVIEKSYDITSIKLEMTGDSVAQQEIESGYNVLTILTEEWQHYTKTLPEKRPYFLEAEMKLKAADTDGAEKDIVTVKIEEVVGYSIQPLLPYIFFNENSDTIPTRYNQLSAENTAKFSINDLRKDSALEIYHQVMNIIGRRMMDNPKAVLTITGCNQDLGVEKNNTALSKARAERVRDYFEKVWGVDPARLKVKAQNLPNVASSAKSQDGIDENRRVEISSNDPEILKNVVLLDTTLRAQSVSSLHFYPTVRSSVGVKSWSVRSELNDSTHLLLNGNSMPDKHLQWDLNHDLAKAPRDLRDIRIRFDVRDKLDSARSITEKFPVELISRQDREKINNKYVDKYSLILYDFGSYTHTQAHLAMLKYVREHSTPSSTFIITGHTDRSGSAEYNMNLSTKRAEYTAKALNLPLSTAKGYGKEQELYDNNFPEGRMYNRTVNIVVETPVE